jgi:phosphoribosylformylglycinamidine synthase
MLWEIEIAPTPTETDREAERIMDEARHLGIALDSSVRTARSYLIEADGTPGELRRLAEHLLVDPVAEAFAIRRIDSGSPDVLSPQARQLNVLFKPGVTDNVAATVHRTLTKSGFAASAVATCRKYAFDSRVADEDLRRLCQRVLANEAIERVVVGPLRLDHIGVGSPYRFQLLAVPIRELNAGQLLKLSRERQLYLSQAEMQTIQAHYRRLDREPTDIELETLAQTWSEHCSHKTLKGRVRYREDGHERQFGNLLKETVFAATDEVRRRAGEDDWCVSVFRDNAGIVKFDERHNVCFKVETHNHPSAIEPYGGANTGLGGVIRDPLGTGLGAKPVCNTDVFCFAPPDTPVESLPPGVLHPQAVLQGVVAGVRDYGNRMGIPTVNGALYFDERYLGNPLVFCGTVGMIPIDKCEKRVEPGDYIVAVGGRTGRDGIHGATFSSAELTEQSESISGGAVQIGNAVMEKMLLDVILEARDRGLYHAITDCGAGGFSSAVGEMGETTGAEVWLEKAPLKYAGLSYTEIWISEAQERMVLAVPPENWETVLELCSREGVEATVIGKFTNDRCLVLKYEDHLVGELPMEFLHEGRPPVIREAIFSARPEKPWSPPEKARYDDDLKAILGNPNVCSKEWIIRQYDHEVQAGSVVKPLVGIQCDGPSDAAVLRPDLTGVRGLVVACGMNPRYGDIDPYWMAASAIDEAVRNCVAVGADPARIAILDNFCWGNTERPETLGSLVRAALACRDVAVAYRTPFISGKDSLNNEFRFQDRDGQQQTVIIPPSLLISALGQIEDIHRAVTMDLKQPNNLVYLVGNTAAELGGSHLSLIHGARGGRAPKVDLQLAPKIFAALHAAIRQGWVRSCHDLSEGGLAVAAAEMAFAGGWGLDLDLGPIKDASGLKLIPEVLFSESNTRLLLEVPSHVSRELESLFDELPLVQIGEVTATPRLRVFDDSGRPVIDSSCVELKRAWQEPMAGASKKRSG